MGYCTRRQTFLLLCVIQALAVIERQIFDFLGFLWVSIFANFFELIFIIFGFFGGYQKCSKYVIAYLIWHLIWLTWNLFLICLYLDVAGLDHKTNEIIKFDSKSESWWRTEGPKCKKILTPETEPTGDVENCLLDYVLVEASQAGFQCVLALLGMTVAAWILKTLLVETESCSSARKNDPGNSLYSIEYSTEFDHHTVNFHATSTSPKPMTPRKVKRRSIMTRGTTQRQSTNSRRRSTASLKSSNRSIQNPINRLMEQQNSYLKSHTDKNFNRSNNNLGNNSYTNLSYHQSSNQSINESGFDEFYANRPSSARSSYSNYHGTRTLNYPSKSTAFKHSHATPQVPQKKNRTTLGSKGFLNSGPPAYTSDEAAISPVDSETTI